MSVAISLLGQQSTLPQMDGMFWLMLLSRICHILGAIILVGGLFYIRSVISANDVPPGASPVDRFFGGPRAVWAKWVGIATALLLITGVANYLWIIKQHERFDSKYHMIVGIKMLMSIAVVSLAALLAGRTSAADALRQNWRRWLSVCLVIAVATVVLGSFLRTFPRIRKTDVFAAPPQLAVPADAPR